MNLDSEEFENVDFIIDLLDVVKSLSKLVEKDKESDPLMSDYLDLGNACYNSYEECLSVLEGVQDKAVASSISEDRKKYLKDILRSLSVQCREGMGESFSYSELVEAYVGVPGKPVTEGEIKELRDELMEGLAMIGIGGSLSEALNSWKNTVVIEKDNFKAKSDDLFDESRNKTEQIISLPEESEIIFEPVEDEWYRGYSDSIAPYKGKITLNIDLEWTNPELKKVVAHEGYPGHFAISSVQRKLVEERVLPPEYSFSLANTPVTPIVEGTCNLGIYLLGWFNDYNDYISWIYENLRTAVFTNSCFLYHEEERKKDDIISYFTETSGAPLSTAEQRFRFIKHPLWHTSIPHYWYGTNAVFEAYVNSKKDNDLQRFIDELYYKVHTYSSFKEEFGLK